MKKIYSKKGKWRKYTEKYTGIWGKQTLNNTQQYTARDNQENNKETDKNKIIVQEK